MNHTPLDWKVYREAHGDTTELYITDAEGVPLAKWTSLFADEEDDANFELIVRAVNSHYDLFEALQNLVDLLLDEGYDKDGPKLKAAKAAIAKAGVK